MTSILGRRAKGRGPAGTGTYLSSSVKVRESHEAAKPLIHLAPQHKLTEEYAALYEALQQPAGWQRHPSRGWPRSALSVRRCCQGRDASPAKTPKGTMLRSDW
jgi:hypothetical protein